MSTRLWTLISLSALISMGCPPPDDTIKDDTGVEYVDSDGDGYNSDEDCDDGDPTVHPGAEEACDEVDNDCDGEVDEGAGNTYYADSDYDGYGNPDRTIEACEAPDGYVNNTEDCDDEDAEINPDALEICNGVDDDCDELIDDDDDSVDITTGTTWYADTDGDGYGDEAVSTQSCDMPSGYVENPDDCDDMSATQYPGADEYCNGEDDDCDGEIDENTVDAETYWYADNDGDGFGDVDVSIVQCTQPEGYVLDYTDCDDAEPTTYPGATEYCDGADNDCDGATDEDTAVDGFDWYADTDIDGFGDPLVTSYACYQPRGYVLDNTDCDDTDAMQFPGADEYCNGEDDDCDGTIDEDAAIDVVTWYADMDMDGYGDAAVADIDCNQPLGYVLDDTDCDDSDASQYPGADEVCNGEDDDCDGDIDEDESIDVLTWYADADADSYGDPAVSDIDCYQPTDYVADNTDCDDDDPAQYPGADEYCNGEDDDCDGLVDEDAAVDVATWYADTDIDTYGDPLNTDIDCDQPRGYVADNTDCDDTDPAQYPGADEYCNGEDDDCDGTVDEDTAMDVTTWYADTDSDTYGDPAVSDIDCNQPFGYVADNTDCDDADPAQYPGADEYCNGEDDDCDGDIDEDTAVDVSTWYADVDSDTYGDPAVSDIDCNQPTGYVTDNTDCDDTDAAQYPGADEYCNGEDDDCDGDVDEDSAVDVATWYADSDSDTYGDPATTDIDCDQPSGYVSDGTDCDDTDASQYPGADEYCNGEDDDCDGSIDEDDSVDVSTWYADADLDSYGDAAASDIDCDQPTGYVSDSSDCDDTDPAQYPGADEYCNGEDDDCDGAIDEDGEVLDGDTFYADSDGDEFGDPDNTIDACAEPAGYVDNALDCDDSDTAEPVVVDASTGSPSGAGTISSPLDTVQAGVDIATQCVVVFAGSYYESVTMNGTDLEITGVEGSGVTTIDATGTGDAAFVIQSGETAATVLTGFTLFGDGHLEISANSYGCTSIITCTDYYYIYCGGGLYVSSSDPTIRDITALGSSLPPISTSISYPDTTYVSSYGGGMCFLDSTSDVSGSMVASNFADQGGGVYTDETSAVTLAESTIVGNEATDGGGFEADGGAVGFTNVASSFNDATSMGGGLLLIDASGSVVNATLAGDDAVTGGGLYLSGSSTVSLMNSIIYGATTGVGVLVESSASFTGTYNNVYGNLGGNYSGITDPTGTDGNIGIAPLFVAYSDDGVLTNDDLHLNSYSSLVDAGDPSGSYDDADGTTNDIGAYGGPSSDWD